MQRLLRATAEGFSAKRVNHLVRPEAVWTSAGMLVEVPAPEDAEVLAVLQRVLRKAAKHWPEDVTLWAEDEYQAMQHHAVAPSPCPVAARPEQP